ncbi:MAG: efflux RND transporter periplasmic adaptor subunit [Chthoniobacterales bacterium]
METKHELADQPVRPVNAPPSRAPMPQMKRSHWVIFFAICAILGLLVFFTIIHVINTTPSRARLVHAPAPVETVPVRRQNLDEVIGGSGSIEQAQTVQLTSQIVAQVVEVPVKIGDVVKKGDLLVRWDDRLIKATLEANRAYVDASQVKIKDQTRQVERYTTLQAKNMGTALELEKGEMALADAKEALAKATLSLRQAELDLENSRIASPLEGLVLERLVNVGENTHRDQVVMKIGSLNTVLLAAKIGEEKMHSVQLGLSAEISFPAFPGERFEGKVVKIDPNIDPVTRTFTTYVEIQNTDFRLKPGLSGFARIRRSAKDVLAVPSISVMNPSGEQASVFVVNSDNHATLRNIRPGVVVGAMTEVREGLKAGERIVTVGQLYLNNNDKVRTTDKSLTK